MPHRDPETGKFVAGSHRSMCYDELEKVAGNVYFRIDAADLGGGIEQANFDAEQTVVDFGDVLDDHEVAEVIGLYVRSTLSGPTTATAESWLRAVLQIGTDPGLEGDTVVTQVLTGADPSSNTIDSQADFAHDNELLFQAVQTATADLADTTNSLAAGADVDTLDADRNYRNEYGGGPVFDEDDELYAATTMITENVSDHRILQDVTFGLVFKEWDVDECPVLQRNR